MSEKYKIREKEKVYFTTSTIVGCIDVFTRPNHKMAIVNSLKHCIKNKGLVIFAWCLMPSHLHMICRVEGKQGLSDIPRDLKKYPAKHSFYFSPYTFKNPLVSFFMLFTVSEGTLGSIFLVGLAITRLKPGARLMAGNLDITLSASRGSAVICIPIFYKR